MWDPPRGLGGLELNARVGLMFSKRIRIRTLIKGRFWRGGVAYIYIWIGEEDVRRHNCHAGNPKAPSTIVMAPVWMPRT